MPDCTPGSLVDLAACFNGLSPRQHQAITTYLLCQIANAGGGGSQTPWISDINGGCFNLNNVCKFNGIGVYKALLTQSGTNAPVAEVLENSLGFIPTYGRDGTGNYTVNSASGFPVGRTAITVNAAFSIPVDESGWSFASWDFSIPATSDDMLIGSLIEILVYPATPQCPDCAS